MRTALLISAAIRPEDAREAAAECCPAPDYISLARDLGAEILDLGIMRKSMSREFPLAVARTGADALQAVLAFRRRAEFYRFICDSESLGIPLATLLRAFRCRHPVYFIAHRITTAPKQLLWRIARLERQVGGIFCYADAQAACLRRLGLSRHKIHRIPFHVDHRFFSPQPGSLDALVLSVGRECRNYHALTTAARRLDCDVNILARSPWSGSRCPVSRKGLPPNVHLLPWVSWERLRALYARATVVAIPLQAVDFQAGITSLLEAMAMARPVVATANPGLREIFCHGEAGLWVPPGDVDALESALSFLLNHPRQAVAMGRRGRAIVECDMTLDRWVERIASVVRQPAVPIS